MSTRKFELINWIYSVSFSNFPKRLAAWALLSLSCLLMCLVSITGVLGSVKKQEDLALQRQEDNIQRRKWNLINSSSYNIQRYTESRSHHHLEVPQKNGMDAGLNYCPMIVSGMTE